MKVDKHYDGAGRDVLTDIEEVSITVNDDGVIVSVEARTESGYTDETWINHAKSNEREITITGESDR